MKIQELLDSGVFAKLPSFIRRHDVFNQIKTIEKPFPSIGLSNCFEPFEFPTYSDNKNYSHIGFSSSGLDGLWDIATMSMRGVCSCMHWDNPHAYHLIGSVVDPFLGIVYLSDNVKTDYGISFRKRALVRLVYTNISNEYRLLIERIYKDTGNTNPKVYLNIDEHEYYTMRIFKDFLSKKINHKYKVISARERDIDHYIYVDHIPKPSSYNLLFPSEQSMSDCNLHYRPLNDNFAAKFAQQH